MRNYFRRVAEGYEKGFFSRLLFPFLDFAASIYGAVTSASRSSKEKNQTKLPFPVLSVGNLTWGGTGKTPFVEFLARKISEQQRTPLILTRGYSQDEVEQFKFHLPNILIGVGKNRAQIAGELAKQHRIDAAILDDGFQHSQIHRDLDIVMVNALNPFGNGKLIPRGILREPLSALTRAEVIVLSHANLVNAKDLEAVKEILQKQAPKAVIAEAYLEPLFFYRAKKRVRVALNRLENQRVTTFSAVGAPRTFQMLLSRLQIKPIRNFEFTDHHVYSARELMEIKHVSDSASAQEIITTEKDYYRCPDLISETLNPLILATRLHLSSGEEALNQKISKLLGEVKS
jgi:tetraacyldisaccharide 4'-kinase